MTSRKTEARQLIALMRAVARLALPASDQLAYLAGIGVGDLADELALDLDGFSVPALEELGLTPKEIQVIQSLDRVLDEMSDAGEESLWRSAGLLEDGRWEDVRRLAREFLFLQGQ